MPDKTKTSNINMDILNHPPKGYSIGKDLDGIVIMAAPYSWTMTLLTFGSASLGCFGLMQIIHTLQGGEPTLGLVLKGILAFIFTAIFGGAFLYSIFGCVRIELDSYTLKLFNGIGCLGLRKNIDWTRVEDIVVEMSKLQRDHRPTGFIFLVGNFDNGKTRIKFITSGNREKLEFIRNALLACKKSQM